MTRERQLLEKLIKAWAQDHTGDYTIADPDPTEQGILNTESYLTWVVREKVANLDLLSLVDRLEIYLQNKQKRNIPDGMTCKKCQAFYEFAEPNQDDGSMICYTCRHSPYK